MDIRQLALQAWEHHIKLQDSDFIVKPSVPILYFGDLTRYLNSRIKIVTVGLNPSDAEFPVASPFQRFPEAHRISSCFDPNVYLRALNDYFRIAPYSKWFNMSFEKILNGLDASFYDGANNTALHTDICSVLATSPTWSGLAAKDRTSLELEGIRVWHNLIKVLQPDVIIISVAKHHLNKLSSPILESWRTVYQVAKAKPYELRRLRINVTDQLPTVVYWGQAAQTPFGSISYQEKVRMGAFIKEDRNSDER